MALSFVGALSLTNTVELTTGDLRQGTAFDNLKATFGQALKIGDLKTHLNCQYDRNAKSDFLSEASLTGDLMEGDMNVAYEVTKNFADDSTSAKLTASTTVEDTKLGAEVQSDGGLTEVSAERDVADQTVQASWLVKAKTARVKLMSSLGAGDKLSAQVDYTPDGGKSEVEVTLDHNIGEGRDLSSKFVSSSGNLEVDYVDNKFEADATWTASASVPYDAGADIMDKAKLSLKRAWKW